MANLKELIETLCQAERDYERSIGSPSARYYHTERDEAR